MKKILLSASALALLSSTANAEFLVGIDYTAVSNMTETYTSDYGSSELDFSYNPITFKLGLGEPGDKYMYIYYQSAKQTDNDGNEKSEALTEFGYDYVGQFDLGVQNLHPLWEFGVAYGSMNLPAGYYTQDSQYTVSFKLGGGASYYVIPQVELIASVNYQYRLWQPIDTGYGGTVLTTDSGINVVVGVNVWPFATGGSSSSYNEDSYDYQEESSDEGIY